MEKAVKKSLVTSAVASLLLSSAMPAFSQDPVEINYWMWDGLQAPVYQKCADAFQAANPGIRIKITQDGWDNYWTTLMTSFASGGSPDVFVNHVTRFPELVANNLLLDLTPLIAQDKVDLSIYKDGLAATWNKDGKQWGLPKDWDTIALVYSKQAVADAGISEADLQNMTWNPDDGGTFSQIVAKLAVDNNGKRGDAADFDKANVKQYGFLSIGDAQGQSNWASFATSAGFKYVDKPFGTHYNYDDPVLAKTLAWSRDLALVKGVSISRELAGDLQGTALFVGGKVAMAPTGSWTINSLKDTAQGAFGFAPMPAGPQGRRSMMNGLADVITASSQHPAEAWKWVQYLGSPACQDVVGASGIVFPAIPSGTAAAVKAHGDQGVDVSAYTSIARPETTFAFPLTDFGNQINDIFKAAIDRVLLNQGDPADTLKTANDEVNKLFQ